MARPPACRQRTGCFVLAVLDPFAALAGGKLSALATIDHKLGTASSPRVCNNT